MRTVTLIAFTFVLSACASSAMEDKAGPGEPELAACNDGIDNDGDGAIDFPADPGCALGLDNTEEDLCPSGDNCPACGNGLDDDGDGKIDYPEDDGCSSANDSDELNNNPASCGGVSLESIPELGMMVEGFVDGGQDSELKSNGCGGSGAEVAFTFAISRPSSLVITTDHPETEFDTVVYLRSSCGSVGSELGCNDDTAGGEGHSSTLLFDRIEPGEYYLIIDGHFAGAGGRFAVSIDAFIGRDEACTVGTDECAPGLLCQDPHGGSNTHCVPPRCSDGIDNESDGAIDFPDEPGCATVDDNDESDDCPSGPNCAACSNGTDDDGDGQIDYGADIGCGSAGDNVEEDCDGELDAIISLTVPSTVGSTAGGSDDFVASCRTGSDGPDTVHILDVPGQLQSLHLDTNGSAFDTVLYIKAAECSADDMDCDDSSGSGSAAAIDLDGVEPGQYYVIVDGFSDAGGDYLLNVSGVIADGESCDPASIDMFSCQHGSACQNGVCATAACNDGVDRDGDAKADYPEDPGCESPSDPDESDSCPSGTECPSCGNGIDDDGDGLIDFGPGGDLGCSAASDNDESDCALTPIVEVDAPAIMGNTMGSTNDLAPSCQTNSTAPDITHALSIVGELETLTVDTNGSSFDTVLLIHRGVCIGMDWQCDDDGGGAGNASSITITDVESGNYFFTVDGYSDRSGAYQLSVNGIVKADEPCDADLETAGVLVCTSGTTCTAGTCSSLTGAFADAPAN